MSVTNCMQNIQFLTPGNWLTVKIFTSDKFVVCLHGACNTSLAL